MWNGISILSTSIKPISAGEFSGGGTKMIRIFNNILASDWNQSWFKINAEIFRQNNRLKAFCIKGRMKLRVGQNNPYDLAIKREDPTSLYKENEVDTKFASRSDRFYKTEISPAPLNGAQRIWGSMNFTIKRIMPKFLLWRKCKPFRSWLVTARADPDLIIIHETESEFQPHKRKNYNLKLNGSHPDVFKDRIQGLHQSNTSCIF